MKYGDAMKMLVKIKNDPVFPEELKQEMDDAIEGLEESWGDNRKAVKWKIDISDAPERRFMRKMYVCPTCDMMQSYGQTRHCPYCGQLMEVPRGYEL